MCIHTYLAPILAINLVNSAMPPGRSLTVTTKRTRRPSAASPRSKHLPNTVESMFPPHSAITTLQHQICLRTLGLCLNYLEKFEFADTITSSPSTLGPGLRDRRLDLWSPRLRSSLSLLPPIATRQERYTLH